MYCNNCGKELEDNAVFCSACGVKIEESEVLELETVEDFEVVDIENVQPVVEESVSVEIEDEPIVSNEIVAESVLVKEDAPEKKPNELKRKKKSKTSVLGHVFASLVSILLACFLVVTFLVTTVAVVFSSGSIEEAVDVIDLEDLEVDEIISKSDLESSGLKYESDNLLDFIYDNIDQSQLADPLTKSEYRKIVNSEEFSEYFAKLIEKRLDSVVAGKSINLLEPNDIIDFLREEKKAIKKIIGYEITEERIENLEKTLDANFTEAFDFLKVEIKANPILKTVGIFVTKWLLPILILIDVLFCVLIFIIVRSARVGLNYCGVTILIISAFSTLIAIAFYFSVGQIFSMTVLVNVLSAVILRVLVVYLSVFAASIIMLTTSAIIKRVQRI